MGKEIYSGIHSCASPGFSESCKDPEETGDKNKLFKKDSN
jgi:hypothetical protein